MDARERPPFWRKIVWAIRIDRKLNSSDIDVLSDLFILRGVPGHVRSDNVLRAEGSGAADQSLSVRQHALAA